VSTRPSDPASSPPVSPRRKRVFVVILILFALGLVELTARYSIPENIKTARRILLGRDRAYMMGSQKTIAQPYLLYISAPDYTDPVHGPQNNSDGYRGDAVTLEKEPDVLRILCLGGSTTYGSTVPRPEQAYPAVLEELLRQDLPEGYTDVEVINGGLSWGTSAEMLTHYHFKYHYYNADLVIVNEGGNDAQGYTLPYYHPDNSNWRQPMVNLRPLPRGWRWLARSRASSLLMLNIFYRDQLFGGQFVIKRGAKPQAPWFRPRGELITEQREIPLNQLSFLHNIETLIRSILADEARVVLAPFRAAPGGYKGKEFELSQILRHEKILRDLAAKYSLGYAPFPDSVISPTNWTDHCHLNAAGEREKAAHIAGYVLSALTSTAPPPRGTW
jgi:lysophospholipase L1-like esterase